ncbi:MCM-domain-containing protein [Phlegmacium glaucopus]|nr:MCM-domain-containing protein [Phlegmacium glaucopus]
MSLLKTYLDVVHVRLGGVGTLGLDKSTRSARNDRVPGVGGIGDGGDEDEEREGIQSRKAELEQKLKDLSQRPDIYEYLAKSLAPSIWEMDDVKKGILLQLFGGTNKNTTGRTRNETTQRLVLSVLSGWLFLSGALVLSDGGVCCIDEFDKMSDATRSVLHKVMEQQTVSIAKAGIIITTLNARTSILAAANPVKSKYDVYLRITRNIELPPTLISRFDLLYLVLDQVDEGQDRKLAQHLVGLYLEDAPAADTQDLLPLSELSAYFDHAHSKISPIITEEAGEELVSAYVAWAMILVQLESLIRLSEAHARMRFSEFVELEDVKESSLLMREAIRTSAMDPRTGKIDMGFLNTGTGTGQRKLREDMRKEILNVLDAGAKGKAIKWSDVMKALGEQSSVKVDPLEFSEVIEGLGNEGVVKVVGEDD